MSITLRLSAATVSAILVSAAFGLGLAAGILSAKEDTDVAMLDGPIVVSPSESRENTRTRSISGVWEISAKTRSISGVTSPLVNPVGPMASMARVFPGHSRSIAPVCLVAMN